MPTPILLPPSSMFSEPLPEEGTVVAKEDIVFTAAEIERVVVAAKLTFNLLDSKASFEAERRIAEKYNELAKKFDSLL